MPKSTASRTTRSSARSPTRIGRNVAESAQSASPVCGRHKEIGGDIPQLIGLHRIQNTHGWRGNPTDEECRTTKCASDAQSALRKHDPQISQNSAADPDAGPVSICENL